MNKILNWILLKQNQGTTDLKETSYRKYTIFWPLLFIQLNNLLNWIIYWIESQCFILNWIIIWIEFSRNNFELNIELNQFWAQFKHWNWINLSIEQGYIWGTNTCLWYTWGFRILGSLCTKCPNSVSDSRVLSLSGLGRGQLAAHSPNYPIYTVHLMYYALPKQSWWWSLNIQWSSSRQWDNVKCNGLSSFSSLPSVNIHPHTPFHRTHRTPAHPAIPLSTPPYPRV